MLVYLLICLCLSLAGIAGLQFFYMIYLEQLQKQQKRHIRELENQALRLNRLLKEAKYQSSVQTQLSETLRGEPKSEDEREIWADLIEDK